MFAPNRTTAVMTNALRVLLVEDSPTDAELVVRELRRMKRPIEFGRVEDDPSMRAALLRSSGRT